MAEKKAKRDKWTCRTCGHKFTAKDKRDFSDGMNGSYCTLCDTLVCQDCLDKYLESCGEGKEELCEYCGKDGFHSPC